MTLEEQERKKTTAAAENNNNAKAETNKTNKKIVGFISKTTTMHGNHMYFSAVFGRLRREIAQLRLSFKVKAL